jgi:hypothetical protein
MGLGDKEKAMVYFKKAYEVHSFWLPVLKRAPAFDAMRDDPRFQKLILDLKFP